MQCSSLGLDLDLRKGAHSADFWLAYGDYGSGPVLLLEKGRSDYPQYFSMATSHLEAVTLALDELWSIPLAAGRDLDFEVGFGIGISAVFGSLEHDWVYLVQPGRPVPTGAVQGVNGRYYAACPLGSTQIGCNLQDHPGATVPKTGGYIEPGWLSGGWVPLLFPHVSVPQVGLRYQVSRALAARLGLGLSLTGFWAGLAVDVDVTPGGAHN